MNARCIIGVLAMIILSHGCAKNPFATRDDETPSGQIGTFIPPTAPQIVLENLRFSYQELVIGNFTQCLDSQFVFVFDFLEFSAGDTSWNYFEEVGLTNTMFNDYAANRAVQRFAVEFSSQIEQPDLVLDTAATLVRRYRVNVTDTLGTVRQSFQGIARLDMVESALNFWSLRRWEDLHLDAETRSWAELKNAYR